MKNLLKNKKIVKINRQAKAESLVVNSVGHRPTNWEVSSSLALKGRNPDFALSGLRLCEFHQDRALSYPIDNKAFSLSLTAVPLATARLYRVVMPTEMKKIDKNMNYRSKNRIAEVECHAIQSRGSGGNKISDMIYR